MPAFICNPLFLEHSLASMFISKILVKTTRKTGGLIHGYKPWDTSQRLKTLAFTPFKPLLLLPLLLAPEGAFVSL